MNEFAGSTVGITFLINFVITLMLPLLAFLAFILLVLINKKLKGIREALYHIANNMKRD